MGYVWGGEVLLPRASMGPPIFIGGNGLLTISCTPNGYSFNGAADFHRRKYERRQHETINGIWLQWGRRFSSAEISERRDPHCLPNRRFNGAADFHRRKCKFTGKPFDPSRELQWGRRFSSAEMLVASPENEQQKGASMGPPIFIGGNLCVCQYARPVMMLQWGRRFSSAEICRLAIRGLGRGGGFNGAADFHRRKFGLTNMP